MGYPIQDTKPMHQSKFLDSSNFFQENLSTVTTVDVDCGKNKFSRIQIFYVYNLSLPKKILSAIARRPVLENILAPCHCLNVWHFKYLPRILYG